MSCSACNGNCATLEACQLPIARATRPPRVAFMLLALLRPARAARVALLNWQLACLRDEQSLYVETDRAGPAFVRESLTQQLQCMARIRELESQQ